MSFRGQHEHSIDSKDRVTIPSAYRAGLAPGLVAMEGVESCVEIWPVEAAQRMEEEWIAPLSPMSADGRRLRRRVFATSERLELDSAGRIRLPQHLMRHASLAGPCVVAGIGDHLEIWNREAWGAESEEFESQASDLTERLNAQAAAGAGN